MGIKSILERNPIIPAIKDNITLKKALNSNSELVFIIVSNIINIKDYTDKLKKLENYYLVYLKIYYLCMLLACQNLYLYMEWE